MSDTVNPSGLIPVSRVSTDGGVAAIWSRARSYFNVEIPQREVTPQDARNAVLQARAAKGHRKMFEAWRKQKINAINDIASVEQGKAEFAKEVAGAVGSVNKAVASGAVAAAKLEGAERVLEAETKGKIAFAGAESRAKVELSGISLTEQLRQLTTSTNLSADLITQMSGFKIGQMVGANEEKISAQQDDYMIRENAKQIEAEKARNLNSFIFG